MDMTPVGDGAKGPSRLCRYLLALALAQLLAHAGVAIAISAQTPEQLWMTNDRRLDRVELRMNTTETNVGILQSEMGEVKWLVRGVAAAIIVQLVTGVMGARERRRT